ncbi:MULTISPECIES: putative PEP-binding protein [unclassified Pseudactinotalea]|uniref:putative PEP-binding protein n=1 Tax=unclassified Pseudactinotalea TaxID=2649176 RepID=UPI00128E15ED|nr:MULTISPECIES: putative PEP-binding protein [unclassified Pseudactinotalea]MPV49947.1 phosphoenolpyruvate--protein phosphotransferase [Pseudactinotalea sp. HY160]QGH69207.1 phosphoenolpyruvate--protein phosphotransferase [Pseudactinotalea sp. HY158]
MDSSRLLLRGTPVVPGAGYGPAVRPMPRPDPAVAMSAAPSDPETELDRLERAVTAVADRLNERAGHVSGAAADVLRTGAVMADDPGLRSVAKKAIREGRSACQALWSAAAEFTSAFEAAGGLMAERVTDLEDIRDRVAAELLGLPEPGVPVPEAPSVLLAADLAPADAALLDPELITAIAVRLGGPTSHTAIIARQLGIPCVVGVHRLDETADDHLILVDGTAGTVTVDPEPQSARDRVAEAREQAATAAAWRGEGATSDGHGVDLLANVQDGAGARAAAQGVAVGVGLMRTELAFMASATEPSSDHQAHVYGDVLRAFPDAKVIIRTLDAGSDKPLPFIEFEDESNPALGVRGLRIAADDPGILDRQLDAIAAAARAVGAAVDPWVMAPMVATVAEARFFAERARARGLVPGVMIEVPAAALLAESILAEVDFVSIGTNDLSQYTMAADRLSPALASLCDPWQPAVLALIDRVAQAGRATGKRVGVCGEAAADPLLACVLVGMGVSSLSAAPIALPAVGARLAGATLADCERAAAAALATTDSREAREAAAGALA